ncbi:MAG: aldo/keto reductase [Gammaproteobacteria bacterium]|nr:aldo/keto reductase [Gammaproteobacteria bacterium]
MPSIGRRDLLRLGAASSVIPLASVAVGQETPAAGEVQRYVRLGRTDMRISDVSFGSSRLRRGGEHLVHHALDRGINYFDTADGYSAGASEHTIGRALEGRRDKVCIASKFQAGRDETRVSLMRALDTSLRRLRTDYIDVYFNHAVNDIARMANPEWHEFTAMAKQQGKIRFTGMSGHGTRLIECLDYVFDEDLVDVVLVAYNFGQDPSFLSNITRSFRLPEQPDLPRVLAKAKSRDVGVVTMKTLMGARLNDMRPYETGDATFSQAAFRWVLSDANVDALVISMTEEGQIDEYLGGSGGLPVSSEDLALLERYAVANGITYCRHACSLCEGACPYGVPIPDVLRTRMYATDYGDVRFAREEYSKLEENASACLSCTGEPCAGACPHGIDLPTFAPATHRMLA